MKFHLIELFYSPVYLQKYMHHVLMVLKIILFFYMFLKLQAEVQYNIKILIKIYKSPLLHIRSKRFCWLSALMVLPSTYFPFVFFSVLRYWSKDPNKIITSSVLEWSNDKSGELVFFARDEKDNICKLG